MKKKKISNKSKVKTDMMFEETTNTMSPTTPPTMFSRRESLAATVTGLACPLLMKVPGLPTVQSSRLCKSLIKTFFLIW